MHVSRFVLLSDIIADIDVSVSNLAKVVFQLCDTRDELVPAVKASHHVASFILPQFAEGFNPLTLPTKCQTVATY